MQRIDKMNKIFRNPHRLSIWFLVFLVAGCSSGMKLQVQSQVPTPLATQLPLTLGIYYNENFRDYVFSENSDMRKEWTIDSRKSRVSLFEQILPSMFSAVKPLTGIQSGDQAIDIIFEPEVIDMQVSLPRETRSDMYEAWLKYGIKIYHPDGNLITEWQISGYGKAPDATFSTNERGLNSAIELALRDIGAKLVLDFPKAPGMREWLVSKIDCSRYPGIC